VGRTGPRVGPGVAENRDWSATSLQDGHRADCERDRQTEVRE